MKKNHGVMILLSVVLIILSLSSCTPVILLNFKTTTFNPYSEKSFYYYNRENKNLYFSSDGKFSKKNKDILYTGNIDQGIVSPDSKYIIIEDNKMLLLVSTNQVDTIGKYCSYLDKKDVHNYSKFYYRNIQWNSSSTKVYLKRIENNGIISFGYYDIIKKEFSLLFESDNMLSDFIIDNNDTKLLYTSYFDNESIFLYYNFSTNTVEEINIENIVSDEWFYNYNIATDFCDSSYIRNYSNNINIILDENNDMTLLSLLNKSQKLLQARYGKGLKGHYKFNLINSYFLPGNRFCITQIDALQYKGQIIIDTENQKIMKTNKGYDFYFNISNHDVNDTYTYKFFDFFHPIKLQWVIKDKKT